MRLGPLERRVLAALWQRETEARVRDLRPDFPHTAYTTLMTTLERLHRKGLLDRVEHGRAFAYRARVTKAETVLSFLVDEIGPLDGEMLDVLEQLVRERRRELEDDS
jgi:predicted transcriptional regulator